MARPYTFFKRPTRKAKTFIYYVQFRDNEGKRTTAMSTGQTTKSAAETWVQEFLKKGGRAKFRDTFGKYAQKWWIWGECPYIQGKLARGKKITRSYADVRRSYLDNYILPTFTDIKLSKIAPGMIEKWLLVLKDTESKTGNLLSHTTINHILKTLKIMIREAFRLGLINNNPATVINLLHETPKKKTILTIKEVRELFREDTISSVWENQLNHYTLNLLAASTGLRMGEALGIQIQHVYKTHIDIINAWERKYGLKETKTRVNRIVPIPEKTSLFIQKIIADSPYKENEDLVFYGKDRGTPLFNKTILSVLYKAFEKIGITPEERETRNVTFHSWRHFFNSVCRARGVPDSKLQRVTGHKTQEMTEKYTYFRLEDFREVVSVQEEVFENE